MKNALYSYYRPTKEEFDAIWEKALIIPDTNVLLNLYRYSKETSDDFIKIFNLFSDRIWIPHQIALEYHKNRLTVISAQYKVYSNLAELFKKQENFINSELGRVGKHPYIDLTKYQEQITTFFSDIIRQMDEVKEKHPDMIENDPVRDIITSLFEGKVGLPYSIEDLNILFKEGKRRFENQIAPGFEDTKTKEGDNVYSDLIIWYQIIDKAKKDNRPIIFVTDESKVDWWWKFSGKIIGPRPELIEEIVTKANVWFYMYRPDQFLNYSKNYLNQQINQNTINEIRDIQRQDKEKEQLLDKLSRDIAAVQARIHENHSLEDSVSREMEEVYNNMQNAESIAEHYQAGDIDSGYQMYTLDADDYLSQLDDLAKTLGSIKEEKTSLSN